MDITILLYDGMTALDAIGPYEVLTQLPDTHIRFVAEEAGPIRTDTGHLALVADEAIADVPGTDILLVPGGPGDEKVMENQAVLDWIRGVHVTTTWTCSVCTGALILGAAGVLDGLPATTHWMRLDWLEKFGAQPQEERIVEAGKVITAAGVSAGIDMALVLVQRLKGDFASQAIQLSLEYDPQPPFDAGSTAKAPAEVTAAVSRGFEKIMARRMATRRAG